VLIIYDSAGVSSYNVLEGFFRMYKQLLAHFQPQFAFQLWTLLSVWMEYLKLGIRSLSYPKICVQTRGYFLLLSPSMIMKILRLNHQFNLPNMMRFYHQFNLPNMM